MSAAPPFQLKTFAIEPVVFPRRPHTSDGQQPSATHPRQSPRPDTRVSSPIVKSPRLSLHKKESHGHKGTLMFSSSSSSPLKASTSQSAATRCALEPVDFNPFEHSESSQILIQDPEVSAAQRCDLTNLRAFRLWLGDHFPSVVHTMRSLRLLLQARASNHEHDQHHDDEQDEHVDSENPSDSDPDDGDDHNQLSEAPRSPARLETRTLSLETWQLLFRHATLQVFAPDNHVVTQDATRSGFVFFVLSGSCELRFQPKLLEFLLARRTATTAAATKQQQSPQCEECPLSPPKSPGSLKQRQHLHHHSKKTADKSGTPGGATKSSNHLTSGLRRLSLSHLTDQDVREICDKGVHLKTLRSGGFFGLDAALFEFPNHVVSAISQGALQRSDIGLTTRTCMHVLRLPFVIFQQIRAVVASRSPHSALRQSLHHQSSSPFFFPYTFSQERVDFLRQTFVFQSMRASTLQFLASHMRWLRIPRQEYLFTPGQQVTGMLLVKSGQLKVSKPYKVRSVSTSGSRDEDISELRDGLIGHSHSQMEPHSNRSKVMVETRNVELEILQAHDVIGLHEVCLMRPQFASHCIAMSDDVELFTLSSFALFAALACEPTASGHVVENLMRHHAWYKVREYAAFNHHSSEKEAKLSLAVQQRGPIQCSRCGWAGHVSTSPICVRAESPRAMLTRHTSTVTSSTAGGKTAIVGAASPAVQLPLATRSSRTQKRLSSLVMAAKLVSEDAGELILTAGDTVATTRPSLKAEPSGLTSASPPQSVSKAPALKALLTHSNAIVHADSQLKASLLRGLLPFLCMKQMNGISDDFTSTDCEHEANNTVSELERALRRLDDALVDEAKPLIQPNDFTPLVRPQTEGGGTRRRAGGVVGGVRGSNLNTAAAQAIGRMSTVAAATMEEAQTLKQWPAPVSSTPRSPRSSSQSHQSSLLKKPEPQRNNRAQRRNAANL